MRNNPIDRANAAPRCGAWTRRRTRCQGPAMANGRCRIHGGLSPGAPRGCRNGNFRHGLYTVQALEHERRISAFLRGARETLATFERSE
jgi:hypothetical protein